jgi:hypothetical protein
MASYPTMRSSFAYSVPVLAFVLGGAAPGADGASDSIYTNLSGRACRLLSVNKEGANSTQRCPGVGGFHLLVLDSDGRQSVTLVSAGGRNSDLAFWDTVTRHFSSLGSKAEWLVVRAGAEIRPVALIVRVNALEDPDSSKVTSYLTVTKITHDQACVVAKISPSATASVEARSIAGAAAEKPCLGSLE